MKLIDLKKLLVQREHETKVAMAVEVNSYSKGFKTYIADPNDGLPAHYEYETFDEALARIVGFKPCVERKIKSLKELMATVQKEYDSLNKQLEKEYVKQGQEKEYVKQGERR